MLAPIRSRVGVCLCEHEVREHDLASPNGFDANPWRCEVPGCECRRYVSQRYPYERAYGGGDGRYVTRYLALPELRGGAR